MRPLGGGGGGRPTVSGARRAPRPVRVSVVLHSYVVIEGQAGALVLRVGAHVHAPPEGDGRGLRSPGPLPAALVPALRVAPAPPPPGWGPCSTCSPTQES